jgi:DNA-binding protein HU-beta
VYKRAQKTARNISKNTTIIIPEHNIPAFKPAKTFVVQVKDGSQKEKK